MSVSTFIDGDGGDPGVHPWRFRPRRAHFAPRVDAITSLRSAEGCVKGAMQAAKQQPGGYKGAVTASLWTAVDMRAGRLRQRKDS